MYFSVRWKVASWGLKEASSCKTSQQCPPVELRKDPAVKVPVYTTLAPVQSSRPLEGHPLSGSPRGCPQVIALSTPDPSPADAPI